MDSQRSFPFHHTALPTQSFHHPFLLVSFFFKTARSLVGSQVMCATKDNFTVLCCYDHIWEAVREAGKSPEDLSAGCCVLMGSLLAILTLGLSHLRATSRSPSSRGNENSNLRAQSRREDKTPPREAQTRQQRKGRKAGRGGQQGPSNRKDGGICFFREVKTRVI